jgi:hypothetical protein
VLGFSEVTVEGNSLSQPSSVATFGEAAIHAWLIANDWGVSPVLCQARSVVRVGGLVSVRLPRRGLVRAPIRHVSQTRAASVYRASWSYPDLTSTGRR